MKNIETIKTSLINNASLVSSAAEKLHGSYVSAREALIGTRKGAKAAKLLWDTIKGWLVDSETVNFETARSLIQAWMRADGLRQRAGTERMDAARKKLIEQIMDAVNELTPDQDNRERAALTQAVVRAYQKAAKADKASAK